jgi:hypothetical protein
LIEEYDGLTFKNEGVDPLTKSDIEEVSKEEALELSCYSEFGCVRSNVFDIFKTYTEPTVFLCSEW